MLLQRVSLIEYFHFYFVCLFPNNKCINYFLITLLSCYMIFFSQFSHVISITTRFTVARRAFLTHIYIIIAAHKGGRNC